MPQTNSTGKNREIETAVRDLVNLVRNYTLTEISITEEEVEEQNEYMAKVVSHYNHMMYTAILNCTKTSLNTMKRRICARAGGGFLFVDRPFFEVDVQLAVPSVRLSPPLDDIQRAVNKAALHILQVSKSLWDWPAFDDGAWDGEGAGWVWVEGGRREEERM